MLFSIIIPVHNASETIDRCVGSIAAQSNGNLEILLIENGSIDDSYDKCVCLAQRYNCVHLFRTTEKGVSNARNIGLDKCKGDYIGFCDADDIMENNLVSRMVDIIKEFEPDIVINGFYVIDGEKRNERRLMKKGFIDKDELQRRTLNDQRIMGSVWNRLYKRKEIENIRFCKDLTHCEDTFFNMQVLDADKYGKYYYNNECLYNYIINKNGATNDIDALFDDRGRLKYLFALNKILKECAITNRTKREVMYSCARLALENLEGFRPTGIRERSLIKVIDRCLLYYLVIFPKYYNSDSYKNILKMILWYMRRKIRMIIKAH